MKTRMSRRSAIKKISGGAAAVAVATDLSQRLAVADATASPGLKGRIRHSVCKWCYKNIELEDFCKAAKDIQLQSIELLEVKDFSTLKKFGLTCAMVTG